MWEVPNPFVKADGTIVKEAAEWVEQRKHLKRILQENFYGVMPEEKTAITEEKTYKRAVFDGKGVFEIYKLHCGPNASITFEVYAIKPVGQEVSLPIVMNGGFFDEDIAELAISNGFSIYTYESKKAAPDSSAAFMDGQCKKAYPDYSWRTIAMWGWIQMRVIDWLETKKDVDISKVAVCGHSRYGKASLCAGVHDDRVAACVAVGSGCGGFGSLRKIGSRYGENTGFVETIGYMLRPGKNDHWLLESLQAYGLAEINGQNRENELPFDADFIGAAIAPKPLLILEGLDDSWANPYGTQVTWNAVSEVYKFLGVEKNLGIHFREGGHEFNLQDWTVMIDFLKVVLLDKKKTTRYKTRGKAEVHAGYSWRAPGELKVADPTYVDFKGALLEAYADYVGDRWIFKEAGVRIESDENTSAMLTQYNLKSHISS